MKLWTFLSSNPVTSIIVAAGIATALVLTIFAIVSSSGCLHVPVDRGLMERDGHELRWHKASLPIAVVTARGTPEHVQAAVRYAVHQLNGVVGEAVFLEPVVGRIRPGTLRTVWVFGVFHKTPYNGIARQWYDQTDGTIVAAQVELSTRMDLHMTSRTALHEFGHVLGLCHDHDIEHSIMYPTMLNRRQYLTASDQWVLRDRYGR